MENKELPKVSVIIPVYNVEKYLRRCLDSVLNQTYDNWEAVCVNDGSPDNSVAILDEYAQKDERFKVVTKENGGLSDARNVGLENSTGDYINFLDSDDLIHPQTFEITVGLALRDDSDIVTWYKDPLFRPLLLIKSKLGFNIDNALPTNLNKRYDINKVDSYVTDDVFAHITEESHSGIKYPIKHFYVVRHLIKRELLSNIRFLKGITFEDFPWWSEVILENPRVTITNLPFYYYFPNANSIDLSSKRASKVINWLKGLEYTTDLYRKKATEHQRTQWEKNCMWYVVIHHIARKLKYVEGDKNIEEVTDRLKRLWDKGVFEHPNTNKEKYYRQVISDFIHH